MLGPLGSLLDSTVTSSMTSGRYFLPFLNVSFLSVERMKFELSKTLSQTHVRISGWKENVS